MQKYKQHFILKKKIGFNTQLSIWRTKIKQGFEISKSLTWFGSQGEWVTKRRGQDHVNSPSIAYVSDPEVSTCPCYHCQATTHLFRMRQNKLKKMRRNSFVSNKSSHSFNKITINNACYWQKVIVNQIFKVYEQQFIFNN